MGEVMKFLGISVTESGMNITGISLILFFGLVFFIGHMHGWMTATERQRQRKGRES